MGTMSVVMSAVYGCTLLYANMHRDQGYCVKSKGSNVMPRAELCIARPAGHMQPLCKIEFSLFDQPSTMLSVSRVDIWKNTCPHPSLEVSRSPQILLFHYQC